MRIIGIDYGIRRVGIAVSDPTGIIATPLKVLDVKSDKDALVQIAAVCAEEEAEKVVIGLPLNMDGTSGEMAEKVRRFVARLEEALTIPIEYYDERMSTGIVEKVLLDADMSRSRRKEVRDKLAAQVILQSYLDSTDFDF